MAIDFTNPKVTDNYVTMFVPNILSNQTALARMLDSGVESITGTIPTNAKRYNRSSSAFEEWNGSAWVMLPLQGIYFSGGNVGINAPSPSNQLHLRHATNPVVRLESVAGGSGFLDFDVTRFVVSAGGGYLSLVAGNAERVRLPAAGGLLVNRTSDSGLGPLQVFDSAGALGDFSSSFAGTALFRVRHSGAQLVGLAVQNSFTGTDGASGLQLLVDPAGGAYVAQREAQPLYLQTDGTTRISIDGAGAVDVLQAMRVRSDLNVYGASSDRLVVSPQAAGGGALVRATNNANSAFAPLILDGSTVLLYVAGAERGRVDTNGTFIVNGTSRAAIGGGVDNLAVNGSIGLISQINANPGTNNPFDIVNRSTGGTVRLYTAAGSVEALVADASGNVYAGADNTRTLGITARHWSTVYATALQRDTAGDLTINAANAGGAVKVRVAGTEYLHLSADGRFSGTALHNNAAGLAGTTRQFVGSLRGTTLTTSSLFNLSAASCSAHHGVRVGNEVYCTALFNVTASAAGEAQFFFTPPIATNTTTTNDAPGVATADFNSTTKVAGVVKGGGGSNTFSVTWNSPAAGSYSVYVSFMYEVK